MSRYDLTEIKKAVDDLHSKFALSPNQHLQAEFGAGLHPYLLSYAKVATPSPALSILERYLIGAASALHQPSNYYDIFRVCRCVKMVQILNTAIDVLTEGKTDGLSSRLDRIKRETDHDAFDATLFELATAARYVQHPRVDRVNFVRESSEKTPDFIVDSFGIQSAVECKKIARSQNFTFDIRNAARDVIDQVIFAFQAQNVSTLVNITFNCNIADVSATRLIDAAKASFRQRTAIIESQFTVSAIPLEKYNFSGYILNPSPGFFWNRYGFRLRSEWFGLITGIVGKPAKIADLPSNLAGGMSSWISDIEWDVAVRWKIGLDDVVAKYRRFAFDGFFNALKQIKANVNNSVIHVWLESEHYLGGRKTAILDLKRRLTENPIYDFGWIVLNETLLEVSPKGIFDLVENAHFLKGPSAMTNNPLVEFVFTPPGPDMLAGEFGTGAVLPDIDD